MSRLLSALLLGSALATGATAMAADTQRDRDAQARDNQTQAQPNSPNRKPDQRDADRAAQGSTGSSQPGASDTNRTGQSDPAQHNQTTNQAGQAGADEGNMGRRPDQPGGEVTAQEKEYLADIKKCESMSGDQKKQCVSAAKKKAGQM